MSATPTPASKRALPPVAELSTASLALVIAGGIVMVSTIYPRPSLAVPVALLGLSALLLGVSLMFLSRLRTFAWKTFSRVGRWALLAYLVSGGMIEFAFLHNHVSGGPLLVLTLMLSLFVINVPLIISFTVARYQDA